MTTKESQSSTPENKKANTQIPVIFQNIKSYEDESKDSRFLKMKIWLMHTGQNFNGSSFDKAVVENAIPTLANTPVLAFIEENADGEQDFSDHRMVLHRTTDGDIDLKYLGSAVGVIPEDNNARWETRVTDAGDELEYLVVDALMWTKWDEPINIMKEKGFTNQSMELSDNYSGSWDEDGIFHFESFSFFGACLLGEGVMPAMNSSVAEVQFSKNSDIKNTIESKLQEFYALFSNKGGNKEMTKQKKDEKEKVVSDYEKADVTELEDETVTNSQSDNPENVSDDSIKADEAKATDTTEDSETTVEKPEEVFEDDGGDDSGDGEDDGEDGATDPEEGEVTEEPETPDPIDPEPEPEPEPEEPEEDEKEDIEPNVSTGDDITSSAIKKPKKKPVDFEAKFNALQEDYETLKSQLSELQSYKRQREEEDIKAKFEGKISKEEFAQVFSDMKDSDIEAIEKELFALIGKKNYSIQQTVTENANKIKIPMKTDKSASDNPYSALEVYINK